MAGAAVEEEAWRLALECNVDSCVPLLITTTAHAWKQSTSGHPIQILSMGSLPIHNGAHKRARGATHTAVRPLSRARKALPATLPSTGSRAPYAIGETRAGKAHEAARAFSPDHASRRREEVAGTEGPARGEVDR